MYRVRVHVEISTLETFGPGDLDGFMNVYVSVLCLDTP